LSAEKMETISQTFNSTSVPSTFLGTLMQLSLKFDAKSSIKTNRIGENNLVYTSVYTCDKSLENSTLILLICLIVFGLLVFIFSWIYKLIDPFKNKVLAEKKYTNIEMNEDEVQVDTFDESEKVVKMTSKKEDKYIISSKRVCYWISNGVVTGIVIFGSITPIIVALIILAVFAPTCLAIQYPSTMVGKFPNSTALNKGVMSYDLSTNSYIMRFGLSPYSTLTGNLSSQQCTCVTDTFTICKHDCSANTASSGNFIGYTYTTKAGVLYLFDRVSVIVDSGCKGGSSSPETLCKTACPKDTICRRIFENKNTCKSTFCIGGSKVCSFYQFRYLVKAVGVVHYDRQVKISNYYDDLCSSYTIDVDSTTNACPSGFFSFGDKMICVNLAQQPDGDSYIDYYDLNEEDLVDKIISKLSLTFQPGCDQEYVFPLTFQKSLPYFDDCEGLLFCNLRTGTCAPITVPNCTTGFYSSIDDKSYKVFFNSICTYKGDQVTGFVSEDLQRTNSNCSWTSGNGNGFNKNCDRTPDYEPNLDPEVNPDGKKKKKIKPVYVIAGLLIVGLIIFLVVIMIGLCK